MRRRDSRPPRRGRRPRRSRSRTRAAFVADADDRRAGRRELADVRLQLAELLLAVRTPAAAIEEDDDLLLALVAPQRREVERAALACVDDGLGRHRHLLLDFRLA